MKPTKNIENLKPDGAVNGLELLVLRRYPKRMVTNKEYTGSMAAACGRDDTGIVGIVLWGDQADRVKTGDRIRIDGGWCRMNSGELVVSTGQTGELTILNASEVVA